MCYHVHVGIRIRGCKISTIARWWGKMCELATWVVDFRRWAWVATHRCDNTVQTSSHQLTLRIDGPATTDTERSTVWLHMCVHAHSQANWWKSVVDAGTYMSKTIAVHKPWKLDWLKGTNCNHILKIFQSTDWYDWLRNCDVLTGITQCR